MNNQSPKNSNNQTVHTIRHNDEYERFIQWIALPKELRTPKTQCELARKFRVGQDTLSAWKQREGFWGAVETHRRTWGRERTPNVLLALYNRAIKSGEPQAVRLWLEVIEGFDTRQGGINLRECSTCAAFRENTISDEDLFRMIDKQRAFFEKRKSV